EPKQANIVLTVTAGPHAGREFKFEGHDTFLVGRSRHAHLSIKDRYLSRFHFVVEVNPPRCRLKDLDSNNGTRVNSKPVNSADLREGDEIGAGHRLWRLPWPAGFAEPELQPTVPEIIAPMPVTASIPAEPALGILEKKSAKASVKPKRERAG